MIRDKPVSTPVASSSKLSEFLLSSFFGPHLYYSTIGAPQYLTTTISDIAYVINKVSQFMQHPIEDLRVAMKHILRYLKHTISYGLLLQPILRMQLNGFIDANWVGCQMTASPLVSMIVRNFVCCNFIAFGYNYSLIVPCMFLTIKLDFSCIFKISFLIDFILKPFQATQVHLFEKHFLF